MPLENRFEVLLSGFQFLSVFISLPFHYLSVSLDSEVVKRIN